MSRLATNALFNVGGFIVEFGGTVAILPFVIDRIGLIDEKLRISEDTEWLSRAKDDGVGIHLINQVLVRRRLHSGNTSRSLVLPEVKIQLLDVVIQSLQRKRAAGKKT